MEMNVIGRRFGRLTVLHRVNAAEEDGPYARYLCVCDCGKQVTVSPYALGNGRTSCGCDRIPARNDLRGRRFGQLTVIRPVLEDENGRVLRGDDPFIRWECRCACGKRVNIHGLMLVADVVHSCGCDGRDTERVRDALGGCRVTRIIGRRNDRFRLRAQFGVFEYELGTYPSLRRAEAVREKTRVLLQTAEC